ncbi:MAG: ribosome small subunit-dependent GTPase, partial [Gemmatimonadetes bacterium]|nr:ribosome small subunit-dependent GTPase [Gemmatimonadota bacterium]
MTTGQVIEATGGTYTVRAGDDTLEATLRGRLKRSGDVRDKVVIGDRVGVV